jgi:hypothetical protein
VLPGEYTVALAQRVNGELTALGGAQQVRAVPLLNTTLPAQDREELLAFQHKVARLQRAVLGAAKVAGEAQERIDHLRQAILDTPTLEITTLERLDQIEQRLKDLQVRLSGDPVKRERNEPTPPSITQRVQRIVASQWNSTAAPTGTNRDAYRIAGAAFESVLSDLRRLIESDLDRLEHELEEAGTPWTPGRVPRWTPE